MVIIEKITNKERKMQVNPSKPVHFIAQKAGVKYPVKVESYINSALGFGSVHSSIPEQPKNMRDLVDLRQKGYIITTAQTGVR